MRVQSRGAMESGARSANGDGCFFFCQSPAALCQCACYRARI